MPKVWRAEEFGVFDACLIVLLGVHLLAVDLAMAGPLAALWLGRRGARGHHRADRLADSLARQSLAALGVGLLLGGALLALAWLRTDRPYLAAVARVPAGRLWFALLELLFYAGCITGYLALGRRGGRAGFGKGLLAVLAATDLMYHFPPLFAILSAMAVRPELLNRTLDGPLFRALLVDPEVLAQVVHIWLAALAVTAVFVMRAAVLPSAGRPADADEAAGQKLASHAARWALAATALQLPVGVWLASAMPAGGRQRLFGGDPLDMIVFITALVLALGLVHHLAAVALGDAGRRQVRRCQWMLAAVVLLMAGTLQRTHQADRFKFGIRSSEFGHEELDVPDFRAAPNSELTLPAAVAGYR